MRTVIFSDTHLTAKFDQRKFNFLKNLISGFDQVIINGDFWDSYFVDFNLFMQSRWQELFTLLKAKQTVYLYGNHDPQKKATAELAGHFSNQQLKFYDFYNGKKLIHIEHGDRFLLPPQDRYPWIKVPEFVKTAYNLIEFASIKLLRGRTPDAWLEARYLRSKARSALGPDPYIILGHSHFVFAAKKDFNCGFIQHGCAYYIVIDAEQISLKQANY
jgi:predicted phosphodiesterase